MNSPDPRKRSELPQSIEDIEFPELSAECLLALDRVDEQGQRMPQPDLDHDRWGHARVDRIDLCIDHELVRGLGPSLLLGLHSCEDQSRAAPDDITLEFFYDINGEEQSVTVGMRRFLELHLENCLRQHAPLPPNIVLVLCNPVDALLDRPLSVPTPAITVHYALGDVISWAREGSAPPTRAPYLLNAADWRLVGQGPPPPPFRRHDQSRTKATTMINDEAIRTYAGLYVMKQLDLDLKEGGVELSVSLPHEFEPLEPILEQLVIQDLVEVDKRKGQYVLSKKGLDYLSTTAQETEAYIDEFDDEDTEDMVEELKRRRVDPMRVRFLWGWYQGEFDDLVVYQQRRGLSPIEHDWAQFLLSPAFYEDLARDFD